MTEPFMPTAKLTPDTRLITTHAVMSRYRERIEALRTALRDVQRMALAGFRGDMDESGALSGINNRCCDALKDED